MRTTIIDAEWTTQPGRGKRLDGYPYNDKNFLVSLGMESRTTGPENYTDVGYFNLGNRTAPLSPYAQEIIKETLEITDLLVAHNMKADLAWLREVGFDYQGDVWCTMVAEYVLAKGQKVPLDLTRCCERRGVPGKDDTKIKEYLAQGLGYEDIPFEVVEEYGRQDVVACGGLYSAQRVLLGT